VYVVFLGAPGAGKGTQASILAQKLGLVHIATGDVLRDAVRRETELGKQAKGFMDRGELVPDSLVVNVVMDRLEQDDAAKGAVLDGFPRNAVQARALDEALAARSSAVDLTVYLDVPEEALMVRLGGRWECSSCRSPYHEVANPPKRSGVCDQCGGVLTQRADDQPETIKRRLQVYFEQTAPLLEYYRDSRVLAKVNGEQPIPKVTEQVLSVVRRAEKG